MNNQEISDFITNKENLQIAMEVTDLIEELKDNTHRDFWVAMNQELTRLVEQNCFGKWVYRKFNLNAHKKPWSFAYISMVIHPTENKPSLLGFAIGQKSKEENFRIMCGVTSKYKSIPELTTLRGLLISVNLDHSDDWWAGRGNLPIIPYTTEFIYQMYNNKEEYIKECAQTFWEKFTFLLPEVEKINLQFLETHQNMENKE